MHTISKTFVGAGVAFVALFSLALTFSTAKAADLDVGGGGWYAESYTDSYPAPYDYYPSYGSTGWYAESYTDSYPASYDYGYSSPSFSYPSFSSPGFGGVLSFHSPALPQMPTFVQPNVANACTAPNTCNVDNSYTDHSIFNAPTTVTIANTGDRDDRPRYDDYYQPRYPAYQPPVSYAQAPYISLSSTPYTGLELTPAQEVLYWSFLILWCLAIAYLVVYKRVLQKTVGFLNGFLFGSTTLTASGSAAAAAVGHAHAAPAPKAPAAKAELVEEGIDPFILSQIKR